MVAVLPDLAEEAEPLASDMQAAQWDAYAEVNGVNRPDEPVVYAHPVTPGKYERMNRGRRPRQHGHSSGNCG
jgi:hypothetical protein